MNINERKAQLVAFMRQSAAWEKELQTRQLGYQGHDPTAWPLRECAGCRAELKGDGLCPACWEMAANLILYSRPK